MLEGVGVVGLVGAVLLVAVGQGLAEGVGDEGGDREDLEEGLAEFALVAVLREGEVEVGDDVELVNAWVRGEIPEERIFRILSIRLGKSRNHTLSWRGLAILNFLMPDRRGMWRMSGR